ncbi:MAG: hypothetical protein AAGD14_12160 [Planctomycetota bacterium]
MHRFAPLCLVLLLACGPSLHVGYARAGYVVPVARTSEELRSRINYDGVVDGLYGFRFGPDRKLYACSYRTGTILRYRPSRARFETVVARDLPGPVDLAFLPDGSMIVACTGTNEFPLAPALAGSGALVRVSEKGVVTPYLSLQDLGVPMSLAVGPDGRLYVGARNTTQVFVVQNDKLEPFVDAGRELPRGAWQIAIAKDGSLWGSSPFDRRVARLTPTPFVIEDPEMGRPGGIVFGRKNTLFVTSLNRGEIREYDANDGTLLRVVQTELAMPWALR